MPDRSELFIKFSDMKHGLVDFNEFCTMECFHSPDEPAPVVMAALLLGNLEELDCGTGARHVVIFIGA